MDELDRILAENEELEPSSGFARRVMDALEQDQTEPAPIPFPWMRLLPAALGAVGIFAAFGFYIATGAPGSAPAFDLAKWLDHPLATPLGGTALALLGSWVAVRLSMRLAAPTR